ncbi:MAG: PRC-barrel domain containing protein [Dermatophilaceae bacterium]
MNATMWSYPPGAVASDLVGFHVQAQDGAVGSIDETSMEIGRAYLVVDAGPWIDRRRVMLPAGMVSAVDPHQRVVYVERTKHQIEHAPELDESTYREPAYAAELSGYYWGPR